MKYILTIWVLATGEVHTLPIYPSMDTCVKAMYSILESGMSANCKREDLNS